MFKINDMVRLVANSACSSHPIGHAGPVLRNNDGLYLIGPDTETGCWSNAEDIELVTRPIETKAYTNKLNKAEYMTFVSHTFAVMYDLIKAKNSDYTAGSEDPFANFRQSSDFGVEPLNGLMVRMGDKLQRIKSFCKNGKLEVVDEGVEDAFRDLIGYSLIALGMLSEKKNGSQD